MSAAAREVVLQFLDDLRAAESASADILEAWIDVCALDGLRGGLRSIAEREAAHAVLLADRLRELGGTSTATVAAPVRIDAHARFGSLAMTDEEKLGLVITRYPDAASATGAIERILEELGDDAETRELLRLIAAAEAATVAWLRAYHTGLRTASIPSRAEADPRLRLGSGSEASVWRAVDRASGMPPPAKPARQT